MTAPDSGRLFFDHRFNSPAAIRDPRIDNKAMNNGRATLEA